MAVRRKKVLSHSKKKKKEKLIRLPAVGNGGLMVVLSRWWRWSEDGLGPGNGPVRAAFQRQITGDGPGLRSQFIPGRISR